MHVFYEGSDMRPSCVFIILIAVTIGIYSESARSDVLTAQWMQDLYASRPDTKLRDIIIPATHNSGTSRMNLFSRLAPGDTPLYELIRPSILTWSRCHFQSIYQQLIGGIRKFDLRVAVIRNKPF